MKRSLILILSIILAISLVVVSCTPENMPENKSTITIKYDLNGGVGDTPMSQTLSVGDDDKISDSFVPRSFDGITRDGYYLYSWNTKADGSGGEWFPDTSYVGLLRKSFGSESTVTLYAIWIPVVDHDGILYEKLDDSTYSVVRLTDSYSKTEIIIPDTVDTLKVTSINARAFYGRENIVSVKLPSSIIKIGENAFAGCGKLTVINIDKEEEAITGQPWGAPNDSLVINWKTDEESKDSTDTTDTEKKDDSDTTDKERGEETGTKELDESTIKELTEKNEDITKAFGEIGGWVDSFTKKEVSFTSTMTVDVTSGEGVTFASQEEHNKLSESLKKDKRYENKEYKGSPKSYTTFSFKCDASPNTSSDGYIYWDYSGNNYIKYKITEETTLKKDNDGYISYEPASDDKGNYLINFDNYLLCDIEAMSNALEMSDSVIKDTITRLYSILSKGATVKGNAEVKKGKETLDIAFEAVVTADESTRDIKIEIKSLSVKIGEKEVLSVKFTLTINLSSGFEFSINNGKMGAPKGKAELKLSDVEIKVYEKSTLTLTLLDIIIDGDKPELTFEVQGLKETISEYSAELVKLKFLFDKEFLTETEQPDADALKCLKELEFKIGDEICTKESVSAVIKNIIKMFTGTPVEPPAE